jgi:hypothetical protein
MESSLKVTKTTTIGLVLSIWASYTARNIVIAIKYAYYTAHEYNEAHSTVRDTAHNSRFELGLWGIPSLAMLVCELRFAAIELGVSFCDPKFVFTYKHASEKRSQELYDEFKKLIFPTDEVREDVLALLRAPSDSKARPSDANASNSSASSSSTSSERPYISAAVVCASIAYQAVLVQKLGPLGPHRHQENWGVDRSYASKDWGVKSMTVGAVVAGLPLSFNLALSHDEEGEPVDWNSATGATLIGTNCLGFVLLFIFNGLLISFFWVGYLDFERRFLMLKLVDSLVRYRPLNENGGHISASCLTKGTILARDIHSPSNDQEELRIYRGRNDCSSYHSTCRDKRPLLYDTDPANLKIFVTVRLLLKRFAMQYNYRLQATGASIFVSVCVLAVYIIVGINVISADEPTAADRIRLGDLVGFLAYVGANVLILGGLLILMVVHGDSANFCWKVTKRSLRQWQLDLRSGIVCGDGGGGRGGERQMRGAAAGWVGEAAATADAWNGGEGGGTGSDHSSGTSGGGTGSDHISGTSGGGDGDGGGGRGGVQFAEDANSPASERRRKEEANVKLNEKRQEMCLMLEAVITMLDLDDEQLPLKLFGVRASIAVVGGAVGSVVVAVCSSRARALL